MKKSLCGYGIKPLTGHLSRTIAVEIPIGIKWAIMPMGVGWKPKGRFEFDED